jgi:cold-inducible RNA-binding protein
VTRIYVGNLPFSANEDDVRSLFTEYGTVEDVSLVSDRETGRPRGFGFVEMDNQGANAAIQALDGLEYGGRNLRVNEARPREERPPRRDGGGYGGGGRSGGGGGYGRDRDRGGRRNDW